MAPSKWATLKRLFTEWIDEEEGEPEHKNVEDAEPAGRAASVAFMAPSGKILFVKRADTEENFPGHWAWPGGKLDGDESLEDCARRECSEEIGKEAFDGMSEIDRKRTESGWDHATFAVPAKSEFEPKLNAEHSEYRWADPKDAPQPLHPGVAATLAKLPEMPAATRANDMALDRASVREKDADGRLHIEQSNISKANICEYLGSEIPGAQALGLNPDQRYRLLRDPVELERAADTFNRLPVLKRHVPVTADTHDPELVIGATGENATFEAPYLHNSLVFWPKAAIDDIESGSQRQLSSAYRYRADMTPGTYQNEPYDGVMRDIVGNHVALVTEGRAGPDVMVGDSAPVKEKNMKVTLTRLLAGRAIKRLGLDAKGIKAEDLALAMDEDMPGEDELDPNSALPAGLKKAEDEAETEEEAAERKRNRAEDAAMGLACAKDEEPETDEERKERMERREASDKRAKDARRRLGRDESEEERKAREEKDRAEDRRARDAKRAKDAKRGKDEEPEMVDKKAMDAAIADAEKRTEQRVLKTQRDIHEALGIVRPAVGNLPMAYDSAEAVFGAALKLRKVNVANVPSSAYRALYEALPAADTPAPRTKIAMDAGAAKSFADRHPAAASIKLF